MLDRIINIVNVIVAIGNIVDLFLFPLAIYQFGWEHGDPRLTLLGYMSMFFIGWMTSMYVFLIYKDMKRRKHEKHF